MVTQKELSVILDPSLVLYLPLWKKDGAIFMSDDAYGYQSYVTGAVWTFQGRSFDGVDDKINLQTHDSLEAGAGNQTILAWIKTSATTDQAIVYMETTGAGGSQVSFRVLTSTGVMRLNVTDGTNNAWDDGDVVCNDGVWHHVVGIWQPSEATKMLVYTDGLVNSMTHGGTYATGSVSPNQKDIGLRSASDTMDFNGSIGEVWIYNRMLSPLEIQNIYEKTKWRYR